MADVPLSQITIPDARVAWASLSFVRARKVPTIPDPASTPENPLPDIPKYGLLEHIKQETIAWYERECEEGDRLLRGDETESATGAFI